MNADLESMKENYNRAKRAAKLAIFNAKNAERLKFCEELKDEDRKRKCVQGNKAAGEEE